MFKNFIKRTTVILLSFMMAIQVIPFSMYDMDVFADKISDNSYDTNIHFYDADGNLLLKDSGASIYYKYFTWHENKVLRDYNTASNNHEVKIIFNSYESTTVEPISYKISSDKRSLVCGNNLSDADKYIFKVYRTNSTDGESYRIKGCQVIDGSPLENLTEGWKSSFEPFRTTGNHKDSNLCIQLNYDRTYNINYLGDDDNDFKDQPTVVKYSETFTVNHPTRTGYVFDGWKISNMDSNGHYIGTNSINDEEVSGVKETTFRNLTREDDGTITFVPEWTPIKYNIEYDLGGIGSFETIPSAESQYDETLLVDHPISSKYTFTGWTITGMDESNHIIGTDTITTTSADAVMKTVFKNLRATPGEVIFTANWMVNTYNISYDLNDGEYGDNHPNSADFDTQISIYNPTRQGYNFAGWTITGMGTNTHKIGGEEVTGTELSGIKDTTFESLTDEIGGTVKFEAEWTPVEYDITYDLGGGTAGSNKPQKGTYNTGLTVDNPTREGYVFSGWNITGMDESNHIIGTDTITTTSVDAAKETVFKNLRCTEGTVKFEATWTPIEYGIEYNLNGGTAGSIKPQKGIFDTGLVIDNPTKEGYVFSGWNITGMDESNHIIGTDTIATKTETGVKETVFKNLRCTEGIVKFEATWTPIEYGIEYVLNYGEFSSSDQPTKATFDIPFEVASPTREGYIFGGWTITNMDSTKHTIGTTETTETSYYGSMDKSFMNLRATEGNVTFSANWLKTVPKPVAPEPVVYNGEQKTIAVPVVEGRIISSGESTATDVGTYSVTYVPENGYCWEDGTTSPFTIEWQIIKEPLTITIVGKSGLVYNDGNQKLIESVNTNDNTATLHYRVSESDGTTFTSVWTTDVNNIVGKNAGTYKIQYYSDDTTGYVANGSEEEPNELTVSIAKATAILTAPEKKTGLEYSASEQALVNDGTSDHGDFYYYYSTESTAPVSDNSGWKAEIPTETEAGTWNVWYKFIGDENHNDGNVESLGTVTIGKATASFITDAKAKEGPFEYTEDGHILFEPGVLRFADTKAEYALGSSNGQAPDDGWEESIPKATDVGTYYLWAKITSSSDSINDKSEHFTGVYASIIKAINSITSPGKQTWAVAFSENNNQTKELMGFENYFGDLTYTVEDVKKGSTSGESVMADMHFNINNPAQPVLTMSANTPLGTYVVTIKGEVMEGINYTGATETFDVIVNVKDQTPPIATFDTTHDVASSQTLTLKGTDKFGIEKYYFGSDVSGDPDIAWEEGITKTVDSNGTYYLILKDEAGNISSPAIIKFYETKMQAPEGTSITPSTIITVSSDSFNLPTLTGVAQGYQEASWKVGDTEQRVTKGGEYMPTGNYTLTTTLEAAPLIFENQEKKFEGSANAQYMEIVDASGGTGHYEYTIQSQPMGNYFRLVDGNKKIEIPSNLPAGFFIITIRAFDKNSLVYKDADYTVEMAEKELADFKLSKEEVELTYPETEIVNISDNISGGTMVVETEDENIATAEVIDNNKIKIKSGTEEGEVILKVRVEATPTHGTLEKEIKVTVSYGNFTVTPISENAMADGSPHSAKIQASIPGVEILYGENDNYDCLLPVPSADTEYVLSDVSRTDIGTTIINYIASCPGYNNVPGSVKITLTDDQPPTGSITESTQALTDHQTVTLQAQDNDKIVAYYFGKNTSEALKGITPTQEFKREKVDVDDGAGVYHFIVEDVKGHKTEVASLEFYNTDFYVKHGSVDLGTILIASGDSFPLPEIEAATGYKSETVQWEVSGDGAKFDQKANYSPKKTATLNADCIELSAELKYDRNEHGEDVPGTKTMWYTKEATAAPAMENIDGWTFTGWNTQSNGKGTYYAGGATVKEKDVIPHEITLYAIWEKNALTFNNVEATVEVSENADQTVDISAAANGTGDYVYTILVQTGSYFEIDNDNDKIIVKAGTPGGNHVLTVQAEDSETHITALATYTITIKRHAYSLVVDSKTESLETTMIPTDKKTFEITNPSGGILSVVSNKTDVARAIITDNTIVITPGGTLGIAELTIHVAETDYYEADTVICKVTVVQQQDATGEIKEITNKSSDRQTVTLYAKHADRVVAVYFGTQEDGTPKKLDVEIAAVEYTEKVEVTEPGKYYLRVKDGNDHITTVDTVEFYMTTFIVDNGGALINNRLTAEGKGFMLPEISPNPGFTAPERWSNGMAPGDTYTPVKTDVIEAKCTDGSVTPTDPVVIPDTDTLELEEPSHNLVIGDSESDLSVNFYFKIPSNYTDGTMTFKIAHSDEERVVTGTVDSKGRTRYCFKINVNQMSDGITWKYEANTETCESEEAYSFYDYLNTATEENFAESYAELAEFCERLKTYGYYAQNYLSSYGGIEHFTIGEEYTEIPVPTYEPTNKDLSGYGVEVTDTSGNLTSENVKLSLVLNDLISLKVFVPTTISSDAELPEIKVNGSEPDSVSLESGATGGENRIVIEIKGISAIRLADEYTITVGDATIKTSAMAYANKLKQDTETFAQRLGAALYDLYAAADEYASTKE